MYYVKWLESWLLIKLDKKKVEAAHDEKVNAG